MIEETPNDDQFVREQEEAAASEAGAIGGRGSDEDVPPEERPVREAGGGEQEGFEEAEALLEEHATHGDSGPDPTHLAGEPERDIGQQEGTYADTDDIEASERNIPDEGHDNRGTE